MLSLKQLMETMFVCPDFAFRLLWQCGESEVQLYVLLTESVLVKSSYCSISVFVVAHY